MEYIDIVFNHWIWDDPYVKAKQSSAFKTLEKMFSDDVKILVHNAGDKVASSYIWGFTDDEFVTIYHTFDLTDEQKKELADLAVLFTSKKKSALKEYNADVSVCFVKLDKSSYYHYPIKSGK